MSEPLVFSMSGNPRGKGRPRATVRGGFARVYTDKKTREYATSVRASSAVSRFGNAGGTFGSSTPSVGSSFIAPCATHHFVNPRNAESLERW